MFLARVLFFKLHESAKFLVASKRASAAVVSLQRISKFNGTNSSWGLDDVVDHREELSKEENSAMRRREGESTENEDNHTKYSPSRPPSISSLALAQEPLLSPTDDEESASSFSTSSYPSSEYARPRRRPDWVNRLPRSLRPAVTDYLGRVNELLDGKWRRITLLIWAIWTLASGGYTVRFRRLFWLEVFERSLTPYL